MFGVAGRHARRRASLASLSSTGLTPATSRALSRPSSSNARRLSSASSSLSSLKPSSTSSSTRPTPSVSPSRSPDPLSQRTSPQQTTRRRTSILQKDRDGDVDGVLLEVEDEDKADQEDDLESQKGKPDEESVTSKLDRKKSSEIQSARDLGRLSEKSSPKDDKETEDVSSEEDKKVSNEKEQEKDSKPDSDDDKGDTKSEKLSKEDETETQSTESRPRRLSFEESEYPSSGSGRRLVRLSVPSSAVSYRNRSASPVAGVPMRRRRAVTLSDHKTCAIVQNNMKLGLGDIMLAAAAEARAAGAGGEFGLGRAGPFGYGAIMGGKKRPPPQPGVKGPTSLFILSDDNYLRKYTKFIIEWPYPFSTN